MLILKAYHIELDPNNRQRTHMAKHAGCARFAFNWGLAERIRSYKTKKGNERFTNYVEQQRELNRLKLSKFPWMYEVSKCAPQTALQDLEKAFQNFYRGLKSGNQIGFPKFKKKGCKDNFRLTGIIKVSGKVIQLPRLGKLRLKETPTIFGRIINATVSRKADRWFVSICVEQDVNDTDPVFGPKIGIDLGLHSFATSSDGTEYENPHALSSKLRKLKRLSRQVSRKRKGSHNRRKAVTRLAKLHWRISNVRKDVVHKLTSYLAKNHSQIMIEDLCVNGLIRNKHLSRAISDMGFYEFRRQLEYKTKWYGSELIIAPRFFPSSKRCSRCGKVKNKLKLSTRKFRCEYCGLEINRDLNAANNLVAASWAETENACLEVGGYRSSFDQCPSMKQEPNTTDSLESAG